MGESLVEVAPVIANKMGEPDSSLGVSVSFGRFGSETLSWEKWSYFSQNKYLEEAGNLSTPGLVAQKKAFFEAHYKKIAAQRAMELENEKAAEDAGRSSEELIVEQVLENSSEVDDGSVQYDGVVSEEEIGRETCRTFSKNMMVDDDPGSIQEASQLIDKADDKLDICNGGVSEEEIGRETRGTFSTNVVVDDEVKDDDPGSIREAKQGGCSDCSIDKADPREEKEGGVVEINEEVLSGNGVVPGSSSGEEVTLVAAETTQDHSPKKPPENEDSRKQPTVMDKGNSKSNALHKARKASNTKRTADKIASPLVRTSNASTPRNSRPISIGLTKYVPRSSKKKVNESPLLEIKNFRVGDGKSMIVGDTDIVKRELKSSQNRCRGSITSGKCSSLKQASSETCERKVHSFPTPRNENKGLQKKPATDRKNAIGVLPFLRSDERAERRKEFLKNLKAKSKDQEEKQSEIKKLRQSLNFKATPIPSFYGTRGKGHFIYKRRVLSTIRFGITAPLEIGEKMLFL